MAAGYREQFIDQGYVLFPQAIPDNILTDLRFAADILHQGVAAGHWTTRHQTVLQPEVFHRAYVDYLNIPLLSEAAATILNDQDIVFAGLACLLGSPRNEICKWHRDFPDSHPEIQDLLANPCVAIQSNAAIYDDQSLWIVPGSHRRMSLDAERHYAARFEPLEFIGSTADAYAIDEHILSGMPGSLHVHLHAGDVVLYNPMLWHAAEYRPEWKRATLHGGFKIGKNIDAFASQRWGLEHNPWLDQPTYLGDPGPLFGPQMKRLRQYAKKYPEGHNKEYEN